MTTTNQKPRTFAEALDLVSRLRSRKAIKMMLIAHITAAYKDSDAGKAEMRVTREDLAFVSQPHLNDMLIELEHDIELIDAEIEELQNQPIGGGAPPAAETPSAEPPKVNDPVAEAVRTQQAEKKGTASGKPRAQGSGAS